MKIDQKKCDGCGLCIQACHEGALRLIDGKAVLVSDSYCDGLGACLPECPQGAISLEKREAAAFDQEAVQHENEKLKSPAIPATLACGCAGSHTRIISRTEPGAVSINRPAGALQQESRLRQWPCQIKLVPVNAPFLEKAHMLIAADCTAFAYPNIHEVFMKNKITLIGCPKLDEVDYADRLAQILRGNEIKSITILRMEVPCCGGIVEAVKRALIGSDKMTPWQVVVINTDGSVRSDQKCEQPEIPPIPGSIKGGSDSE